MAEDTKFIVLVGKYSSKKQASSDLARIKSSVAANAWVLENR